MEIQEFGKLQDGTKASLLTIENKNGMRLSMTDFGAAIVSLQVPDRDGQLVDVVLGYDNVAGYETDTNAFGATIGRVGNRIAGAKFVIDGEAMRWMPTMENSVCMVDSMGIIRECGTTRCAKRNARLRFPCTARIKIRDFRERWISS